MKKILTLLTAIALATGLTLAATGGVSAAGMGDIMSGGKKLTTEQQKEFRQRDTNNDGKISKEEAQKNPQLAAKFDNADTNHDQTVDEGEFARFETEEGGSPNNQSR